MYTAMDGKTIFDNLKGLHHKILVTYGWVLAPLSVVPYILPLNISTVRPHLLATSQRYVNLYLNC
jgi:hypothetical protein